MNRRIVWSYGGGTQSVAIAVLVAEGKLPRPECVLIARMEREMPKTFEYLDRYVRPLLAPVGVTVDVVYPDALTPGLYYRQDDALPLVPLFTGSGGRSPALCSANWKRDRLFRELRARGYGPSNPVTQWIGYSVDEKRRATGAVRRQWCVPDYPLLTRIPLRREHCVKLVEMAGLPTPPRSRCFDCANQSDEEWRQVRDETPELFQLAVRRDHEIRERDPLHASYLHRSRRPLDEVDFAAAPDEPLLFDGGCNSAGCYT